MGVDGAIEISGGTPGLLIAFPDAQHTYINQWVYEHDCSAETGKYPGSQYSIWKHMTCVTAYITPIHCLYLETGPCSQRSPLSAFRKAPHFQLSGANEWNKLRHIE